MIKDGGPAFSRPMRKEFRPDRNGGHYIIREVEDGMSLRDWFAGQALPGLISVADPKDPDEPDRIVLLAYHIADKLIAAREATHDR